MRICLMSLGMILAVAAAEGCKIVGDDDPAQSSPVAEQRVDVNALPINVTAAVKGAMPGGTIAHAEKELRKGKLVYSLHVTDGEKEYDVVVTPDGQILSSKAATR